MNLLLHRHFARREVASAGAGLGAMLPDLVRMVDRGWRPRPELAHHDVDAEVVAVLDGITHHLAIDVWFHRREELHHGERRTAEAFRAAGATARRMPLLAHACWEMLLDGALARRIGPDRVEHELRAECATFARAARLAMEHHAEGTWRVPAAELDRLWRAVPTLASGYASTQGMARRLDGLRASFGLGRADPPELARWMVALASLEPHADHALASLEHARDEALASGVEPAPTRR